MIGATSKLDSQRITNGFTVLKKHAILIPVLSLSLFSFSPLAFANNASQNNALGSLFGALNKVRDAAQNAQAGLAQGGSGIDLGNIQGNPTTNMSDADKQLMAQGMWHDPRTGLVWMRCDLGDSWTGSDCEQVKNQYGSTSNTWQRDKAVVKISQLKFGGYSDWRLPTIEDLYSLYNVRKCVGSSYRTTGYEVQIPKNGGNGTITVPHDCSLENGSLKPNIDTSIFPIHFDYYKHLSASDDNRYPVSTNNTSATFRPYRLWTIDYQGNAIIADGASADAENDQPIGYVLVVRGGHSTGEFEHLVGITQSLAISTQQKQVADAAAAKRNNEIMSQNQKVARERLVAWQNALQVGDRVLVPLRDDLSWRTPCLILQINGPLVLVQTVANGNLWFKRNELGRP